MSAPACLLLLLIFRPMTKLLPMIMRQWEKKLSPPTSLACGAGPTEPLFQRSIALKYVLRIPHDCQVLSCKGCARYANRLPNVLSMICWHIYILLLQLDTPTVNASHRFIELNLFDDCLQ